MPHFGQLPGSGAPTSGCIGHTKAAVLAGGAVAAAGGGSPSARRNGAGSWIGTSAACGLAGWFGERGSNAPEADAQAGNRNSRKRRVDLKVNLRGRAAHSGRKDLARAAEISVARCRDR